MGSKVTSIRIREDLWKEAKILAVKEGVSLKSLIEALLESVVQGAKLTEKFQQKIQNDALNILEKKRMEGETPFSIIHEKTAVELVKEGRGE